VTAQTILHVFQSLQRPEPLPMDLFLSPDLALVKNDKKIRAEGGVKWKDVFAAEQERLGQDRWLLVPGFKVKGLGCGVSVFIGWV
jgi:hypothetical protein